MLDGFDGGWTKVAILVFNGKSPDRHVSCIYILGIFLVILA